MAVEIANAVVTLVPSFRGVQGAIDRELRGVDTRRAGSAAGDGYASGFGSAAKKLVGVIGGAFAAVQVGGFLKDAVAEASDMTEVGTKLQAIYGEASSEIDAFGAKGAKALGMTGLAAKNAAATFGTFGKAAGLGAKENAAFSTELASLAVDMASFSNTSPEEAIEALGSGLRGEAEPLRKYGVLLDDASLRQQALSMGLITTTKEALTPQQKVLASHALIMKQTADAQGDFARTSGGLANQQRILSAQWQDSKGKLGQVFLPAVTGVVSALNDKLFPALETAGAKASEFWKLFSGDSAAVDAAIESGTPAQQYVALIGRELRGAIPEVKMAAADLWSGLTMDASTRQEFAGQMSNIESIGARLREFGEGTFERLREVWDKLWSVGEKLWPSLVSIGESLLEAFKTLSENGLTVWDMLLSAFQGIADVADKYLVPAFEWLARFMKENPASVLTFVGALLAVVGAVKAWTIAQAALNAIMAANPIGLIVVALAAFAAAVVWAYNNVDWFRELVDNAWTFISEKSMWLWEKVLQPVFGWISENIHVVGDFFTWLWKEKVAPAWEGISAAIMWAWDNVIKPYLGFIWDLVTTVGNVYLWLWEEVVSPVMGWIGGAISGAWTNVIQPAFGFLKDGISNVGTFFSDLWTTVSNVWGWIQTKISDVWSWVNANVFSPMLLGINNINTFMSNLWTKVQEVWGNIKNFFVDIATAIGGAVETVRQAIEDILTAVKGFFVRVAGGSESGGVFNNLQGALGAPRSAGGIIPGADPGRGQDNVLTPMRSGEAVMVPEWTQAVGGAPAVYAMNRLAEQGRLGQLGMGFSAGGVIGQKLSDMIVTKAKEVMNGAVGGGGYQSNQQWGPANYGGFAANTAAAKAFIEGHFSGVSSIGGLYGGSVPGSDHPAGKALDVMIANYLSAQGIASGTKIADWFIQNPNAFGTKYVIWRDRINQGGAWAPYQHPGGNNDTLAHRDHVHISFLTGTGQFAGSPTGDQSGMSGGVQYNPAGGWEQWRPTVLQALSLIGQPASLANTVLNQIRTESSGNPRAINLTDSNARKGTPSKGLIQTIDPTFQSYRLPQLANDPYDPLANIVAGMRYAIDRYGSIQAGMRGVAYDNGGMLQPGGVGVNLLNRPEAVLTPPETAAYMSHAKALEAGFAGQVPSFRVYIGERELTDIVRVEVVDELDGNQAFAIDTIGAQRL